MCECLFACLRSSPPFLLTHTHTHTSGLSFSIIRGERCTLQNILAMGRLTFSMPGCRMKPWHGYLRLFHMHAKYRSATRTHRKESRGGDVCGVSVTNYRADPQPRDYLTQNTMATEPAASLSVPVMAHLKLVPRYPWEKVAQGHTIWYFMWRAAALQEGLAVNGRILCVGLINVSVIRKVFFISGPKTLRHTAPLPGPLKQAKRHPALHVKQTVAGHLDCRLNIFSSSLYVPPHCPLWSDRPRIISSSVLSANSSITARR